MNFLHLTVSEIQPGQTISRRPPAHPDTMGENNTPTALKGCGVKIASATGYRVYRPGTGYTALTVVLHPTGYRVSLPCPFNSVDFGAGRQQVSTNMASADQLQSPQITRPVYRLYSLVFTKTGYRVITATTGYRAYQPGTGYTALLHQNRLQSLPT